MKTEYPFRLPHGYADDQGVVHRVGVMRLALARDEITLLQDPNVQADPARLMVLLLARVVTKLGLGAAQPVSVEVIERLAPVDLAYLQAHYRSINEDPHAFQHHVACPCCDQQLDVDMVTGEVPALEDEPAYELRRAS